MVSAYKNGTRVVFLALVAILLSAAPGFAQRGGRGGGGQDSFRFRFVGPSVGNRVAAIAGIPGDPSTYYAGAASGGVWKTSDGGNNWAPIFDSQPVAAIGALAVAASDPSIVWAGTGEAWAIRDSDVMGDGVYKSVDAGKTWTHMGLDDTGRIGRVVVNPKNPDNVYVCALGRLTGPQQERGVYRTNDGGQHWERVLFADDKTGCSVFRWIRTIRVLCLPGCGRWRCTPTPCSAAGPAAEFTFPMMAERNGRKLKGMECPSRL